jgi:diguanylate cyclase (GGDEF)-like protein
MAEQTLPSEETRRLHALHSLKILDAHGDTRFERVTRMAKRLFRAAITVVDVVGRSQPGPLRQVLDAFEAARPRDAHTPSAGADIFEVQDARLDPRFANEMIALEALKIRFYAGCAVYGPDGSRLGTICVLDSKPRKLSTEDLELLAELGEMVEEEFVALSLATSDVLTKLANRRGFEQIASHILPMAKRLKLPLAFVQIDLDGFKEVNDSHGHEAGDRLLAAFARELLKNFRESDVVARCGGDEFCVLMSGAAEADVRQSLARLEALLARADGGPIRFSAGVAMFDAARHTSLADLVRDADTRMYEAKRRRRAASRAEGRAIPRV